MNNRMKQLAEMARDYARNYVADCKHYGYYMEHNEYDLQFEQKFAELIVKECVSMCESVDEDNVQFRYDYRRGVLDCADTIRKHFGVEE